MQANVITESGGIFRTAATAPLIQLDGSHNALWVYDASANLIISAAATSGNDGLGHSYDAGLSATGFKGGTAWTVELATAATTIFGTNNIGLIFKVGTNPFNVPPNVTAQGDSAAGAELVLSSGKAALAGTQSGVFLQDSLASGVTGGSITGQGGQCTWPALTPSVDLLTGAAPSQLSGTSRIFSNTTTAVTALVEDSANGDTNTYTLGKKTVFATGASQLVNSASNVAVNGLTSDVGIGTYRFHAKVVWTQGGTASNQKFGFTGPATSSALFSFTTVNTSSITSIDGRTSNSLVTVAEGQAGTGFVAITELDGWATFTASGTFAVAVACSNAANTFTVNNPFCFLELFPVN